jgi:hypothetical protein
MRTFADEILERCGMSDFKPYCCYCHQPIIWGQLMEQNGLDYFHFECLRKLDHHWYKPAEAKPHE